MNYFSGKILLNPSKHFISARCRPDMDLNIGPMLEKDIGPILFFATSTDIGPMSACRSKKGILPIKKRHYPDQNTASCRSKYSILPTTFDFPSIRVATNDPLEGKGFHFLIAIFDLMFKETIKCLLH